MPVLQVMEEIVEVVRFFLLERIQHRTVEILDVPVPLFQEQIVVVIKVILQERVSERIVEQIVAANATDLEEIVKVIPLYFVEQIVPCATDHGENCGGDSVVRRGADGIVRQIMEEIVKFLREVPQVQFVGCDVPVITQRRFLTVKVPQIQFVARVCGPSAGRRKGVVTVQLWSFQIGGLAAVAFFFRRFPPFFALHQVV